MKFRAFENLTQKKRGQTERKTVDVAQSEGLK
jgi:hypothetical protein